MGTEIAWPGPAKRRPRGSRRKTGARRPAARPARRRVVLLVDDIEDQRAVYAEYLADLGYKVVEAAGGVEAIAQAVEMQPDVIIMDLAMPGLDGFGATRVLKRLALTKRIPVVALTAHGEHLTKEWAESAGCDAYLTKPILPPELSAEIGRFVRPRRR
jgi:CheY-like chemotaxis protein